MLSWVRAVLAEATLTEPEVASGGQHRARRPAHRGARATCWPRCSTSPGPTRGRRGDAPRPTSARRRGPSRRRGGARPGAADGDDRGSRHPPRRPGRGRRRARDDHADLRRLPGDGRDPRRHRGCGARMPRGGRWSCETVLAPAWSSDDITEDGRAKLAAAGHRAAGVRRGASPTGAVAADADRPLPAVRLAGHRASSAGSARRPARRCGSARRAPSPSTGSRSTRGAVAGPRSSTPWRSTAIDPLTDDSVALTFAVPDELRRRTPSPRGSTSRSGCPATRSAAPTPCASPRRTVRRAGAAHRREAAARAACSARRCSSDSRSATSSR